MDDMMKKLLEKKMKSGKKLSDSEKEAKMSVLKALKGSMDEVMADKVHGMKKVSVMSDSPEGLKEGLEKAEDIVEESEPLMKMASEDMEESDESEDSEDSEEMSPDEIDAKIAELMALKEKMKA